MLIYVAGASRELERVEAFIASARLRGHQITHDWTVQVRSHRVAGIPDTALSDEEAADIAAGDLLAVLNAQILVLLAPAEPTTGAWVELGCALGTRAIPVVVAGELARRSIFTRLASIVDTDAEALQVLDRAQAEVDEMRASIGGWRCTVCGCTEDAPCRGGCAWAAPNLCTRCAGADGAPRIITEVR